MEVSNVIFNMNTTEEKYGGAFFRLSTVNPSLS